MYLSNWLTDTSNWRLSTASVNWSINCQSILYLVSPMRLVAATKLDLHRRILSLLLGSFLELNQTSTRLHYTESEWTTAGLGERPFKLDFNSPYTPRTSEDEAGKTMIRPLILPDWHLNVIFVTLSAPYKLWNPELEYCPAQHQIA
jgi:hypothetical protein